MVGGATPAAPVLGSGTTDLVAKSLVEGCGTGVIEDVGDGWSPSAALLTVCPGCAGLLLRSVAGESGWANADPSARPVITTQLRVVRIGLVRTTASPVIV